MHGLGTLDQFQGWQSKESKAIQDWHITLPFFLLLQNQLGISYAELGPQAMSQLVRPPSKQGITVEYSEMQLLQVDTSEIHPVGK